MKCPKCQKETLKVNEKRDLEGEATIRRRRECTTCGYRFTTYERIEIPSLLVVKKNGRKEPYAREKLAAGVYKAFEKRPFEQNKVEELIDTLEQEINVYGKKEIESSTIGDIILAKIKKIDDVAYLRFASVYKSFEDVEMFKKELEKIG